MSNDKENPEFQLMDAIELNASIRCSKCNEAVEYSYMDLDEAMQGFYSEGWRATERNTYCPTCAKKHLKQPVKSKK